MASTPSKTVTTKTINHKTGVTKSSTTHTSGGSSTVTNTTTIGKAAKVSSSKKTASAPAKAAGELLAARWITGPNDGGWTMCGPVAIANHLLAVTGVEASNGDIERLYRAAGGIGDSGAPLEFFLAAAAGTGLAGCRLACYGRVLVPDAGVLLLAIGGVDDLHAAARTRDGRVVLWGDDVELETLDALVLDAWSLTWHGEVK